MPRPAKLLAVVLLALAGVAQSGQTPAEPPIFRSETNLVLVRFQMTPKRGQSADLRPEEIEITEDGAAQKVALIQGGPANPLTVPIEVNLLFDNFRLSEARVGPWWLRDQRLDLSAIDDRQRVSVALWTVGESLIRLTPPTRDARALNQAIDEMWETWARTPLKAAALTVPFARSVAALVGAAAQGRTNVIRFIVPLSAACDSEEKEPAETIRREGFRSSLYGSTTGPASATRTLR